MQYSLRALFVAVAIVAIGVYFLSQAFGATADLLDLLAFFIGVTILGALAGGGLAAACRLRKPWPRRVALIVATLAGTAAGTFVLINYEWHGDGPYTGRPGPIEDKHYVAMTVVRSGLAAAVVGLCIVSVFPLAAGTSKPTETDREDVPRRSFGLGRMAFWSIVFAALGYAWWPYLPHYQEQRANDRLMDAINAGDVELAERRAVAVVGYHGGAKLAPRIAYLVVRGPDARVRLAALKSMRSFDAKAYQGLRMEEKLSDMKMNDNSDTVRAAAAEWLEELNR